MSPRTSRVVSVALVLIAIVSLAPAAQAYVYIIPDARSPTGGRSCYDAQLQITVPMSEDRQRTGRCESMRCGTDYSLSIVGCGVIGAGPGYTITPTDYSKPYPECCPQMVMNSENLV